MELSYSLHLGNDKNKSIKARQEAKNTPSGTTSKNNNAIQNVKQLGKVNHHNLRQYDNNQELIKTIKGSNNITKDVKELYLDFIYSKFTSRLGKTESIFCGDFLTLLLFV